MSNSRCFSQSCFHNCCNQFGQCPNFARDCFYFYSSNRMSGGVIAAIVVSIAVFILLVVLAVCLYRRYRQRQQPSFPPSIYNQQMPPYQPNYNGGVQPLSANRLAGPHNVKPLC